MSDFIVFLPQSNDLELPRYLQQDRSVAEALKTNTCIPVSIGTARMLVTDCLNIGTAVVE